MYLHVFSVHTPRLGMGWSLCGVKELTTQPLVLLFLQSLVLDTYQFRCSLSGSWSGFLQPVAFFLEKMGIIYSDTTLPLSRYFLH